MVRKIILVLAIALCGNYTFAQKSKSDKKDDPKAVTTTSAFPIDELEKLLLKSINQMRAEANLDSLETHEILKQASEAQADFMASIGKAQLENSNKKLANTGLRVQSFGGTNKASELVITMPSAKSTTYTPEQVAESIMKKWKTSKKEKPVIIDGNNVYTGITARISKDGKKAFVSAVFGGFDSFNKGSEKRKELAVKYTKKNKTLSPPTDKGCANAEKFKDFRELQAGLYVEKNKVYLKYHDLKNLKKLLAKQYDGFAVDIIQKAQYDKPEYNIYDNNLFSKGVLTKRIYSEKIFKKNLDMKGKDVDPKDVNSITVRLGKFPKKLKGDYEMNLLVIQNNQVCRTIVPSYIEKGDQASSTPLSMVLMPDSNLYLNPGFKPQSEKKTLNFTIPFDRNKSEFKQEDIKGFLDALKEPDFIIDSLHILAYSSIEGDSVSNTQLQKKRAESIIKVLEKMQAKSIKTRVQTSDSWELFKMAMVGTPYSNLTKMSKSEAIKEIREKRLYDSLEPYLAKQRFAQIRMNVTYDIAGAKEEKYSVAQFNKAVKAGDAKEALKIQYYIVQQVKSGKYSKKSISKLDVPKTAANSGILMNAIAFKYIGNNNPVTEEDAQALKELAKLDPANSFVTYNNLYAHVRHETVDIAKANEVQRKIDALYSSVPKKNVDALNAEYQFMVMDALDTIPNSAAQIQASIEKIKGFYNFKESSWENSLKLAYVFTNFKDYKFAANLLEPYIDKPKVNEQLLFTYISLAPHIQDRTNSRAFITAMKKAKQANPERYKKLVGQPFLTFQVLDNPIVKQEYLK